MNDIILETAKDIADAVCKERLLNAESLSPMISVIIKQAIPQIAKFYQHIEELKYDRLLLELADSYGKSESKSLGIRLGVQKRAVERAKRLKAIAIDNVQFKNFKEIVLNDLGEDKYMSLVEQIKYID